MATKTFLTPDEFQTGRDRFLSKAFSTPLDRRLQCSQWLSERLLQRLSALGGWRSAQPIRLGSWAREELCPKSDVDLLFIGAESEAGKWMSEAQDLGLAVRSRLPQDDMDWTIGVLPFDVLALFSARAFFPEFDPRLSKEQRRLLVSRIHKRRILQAVRKERVERQKRHDSVTNYLEPQLKYGAGGLRDLEQALMMKTLFPEDFSSTDEEAFSKIIEAKEFFLSLRQILHWLGGGDILAAGFQPEIACLMGFKNLSDLMTEVHVRLERGSFYADWVVERVSHPPRPFRNLLPDQALRLFSSEPSLANQYLVRRQAADIWRGLGAKARGQFFNRLFATPRPDRFWVALRRSLILEEALPVIKQVKGLTQHDHYHRYTVETHLYQTLRETDRIRLHPKALFSLSPAARELTAKDWAILRWTALFHDLGKGREQDHSTLGSQLVQSELRKMGIPKAVTNEVAWLVLNHLILTTVAFRQNANQSSTWTRLFDRGVMGRRLTRLAVFSAIDIRATNPDAWNSWKARLLSDLWQRLRSPEALSHQRFYADPAHRTLKLPSELLGNIDPFLIASLPRQVLLNDLKSLVGAKGDLSVVIKRRSRQQLWVRFHRQLDQPGLFLAFVHKLYLTGSRIDAASVMTFKGFGAYDWFLVRTSRSPKDLAARLQQGLACSEPRSEVPKVHFQSVDLVSEEAKEWVISFRGRDQKGLLLAAARSLYDLGLAVQWARVHTWGNQIDDVFCVEAKGDLQNLLQELRRRFVT